MNLIQYWLHTSSWFHTDIYDEPWIKNYCWNFKQCMFCIWNQGNRFYGIWWLYKIATTGWWISMSIMQRRPRKCQGILVIVFILNGNKPNARNNLESQFNPFWPSLYIFRVNFQCLWIRYSLTLIGKLLGRFWDRFTGKVFQENLFNRQLENSG